MGTVPRVDADAVGLMSIRGDGRACARAGDCQRNIALPKLGWRRIRCGNETESLLRGASTEPFRRKRDKQCAGTDKCDTVNLSPKIQKKPSPNRNCRIGTKQ